MEKANEHMVLPSKKNTKEAFFASLQSNIMPLCPICQDTGLVLNQAGQAMPCICVAKKQQNKQKRRANLPVVLQQKTFADFQLKYYTTAKKTPEGENFANLAKKALKGAKDFVKKANSQEPAKGLLLQGNVGSGKTHLAAAIANALLEEGVDVQFLVVPEFLDDLRATYSESGRSEALLMQRAQNAKVLILDDLGVHNFTPWTQNRIFSLINYRVNYNLPFIITTNLNTLDEMSSVIDERTVSRIVEACDIYRLLTDTDIRLAQHLER